jgi:dynein heavy chain
MDTYSKVAKEVEPKRMKVAELNKKLDAANATLRAKLDALQAILDEVARLKKQLHDTVNEKDQLEAEAALTQARLGRADVLTVGLADEGVRWRATVAKIKQEIVDLTGDVFLSSAAISYYGPFTGVYREEIVASWLASCIEKKIPCDAKFNLSDVMGNPVETRDWNLQGLPSDSVSLNNGVMTVRGKRWPLMIDPQAQGNKWIKAKEQQFLKLLKITNPKMLLVLEGCIRTGSPLMLEDIGENLDPALEPVLLKAVYENNGRIQIKLGDSEVDYDKNFLLYMTTKLPNPHYFPEVCIKVTVINFTVTFDGLEEQLLHEVVSKEIPDMLEKSVSLKLQLADDKKTLELLEKKILKMLSESGGNILDDEVLISTLKESKETSTAVNTRVKEAELAAVEIDRACREYTEVSTSGSVLYFVISELANINPMYQFSLFYFVKLFNTCIEKADNCDDIDIRMQFLKESILGNIFLNVCRGLYEADKLTTSFIIATSYQRHSAEINPGEWSLLLRGATTLDISSRPPNPDSDFFTDKMWDLIYAIQVTAPEHCNDLCKHIIENTDDWKDWAVSDDPHVQVLPTRYEETNELHYFHILLLLKAMCPDKLTQGIQEHVRRSLGQNFIIFPSTTVEELMEDATRSTPIVFVLSTGADPTSSLLRYAQTVGMGDSLGVISLGQGQDVKAIKMVDDACKKGSWVLLQNCHLYRSFMPMLEKMCESLDESQMIHKEFRLFLTSFPTPFFPVPVLQNAIKLTVEPPKGLRANVMRSFLSMTDQELSDSSKESEFRRIQFGLKFFHAVVQERRKFGPLGFNIGYEFNDSDLEASTVMCHNMLELDGEIPWDTLLFVIGHINYGGRVTDDWDRRCLLTILEKYVTASILNNDYVFSPSGLYRCPPNIDTATVEDLKKFIDQFPLSEQPEVFGMHENANISYMQQAAEKLLGVILSIQPREGGSGAGGKTPEELALDLAADQTARLPALLTKDNAHPSSFTIIVETGLMKSLGTNLEQEISRFNGLLGQIGKTLADFTKAVKGTIVMTSELDAMFTSELTNEVPAVWTKGGVGYPSLKPLSSWYDDMILRLAFFREWIENGEPVSYWISSMYFPQGFLTSVLQGYSRANMVPVDQLGFEFQVEDTHDAGELDEPPESGVYIHGLFMDGAAWDYEEKVICSQAFGVMFCRAPVFNFTIVRDKEPNNERYNVPLYKTSVRAGTLSTTGHSTNYVISIEVDTHEPTSFWVLRGAALLTMLND